MPQERKPKIPISILGLESRSSTKAAMAVVDEEVGLESKGGKVINATP